MTQISPQFQIPTKETQAEQIIKRSRFIAYINHADNQEKAQAYIKKIKTKYPDARHHCFAYIAGNPSQTTAISMSDDGEPHGTAGKPMLTILQYSNIGEIVAVIVRYFGGTKLGTGGLVRAYSTTLKLALEKLPTITKISRITLQLTFPFQLEDSIRRILKKQMISPENITYNQQVSLTITIPEIDAKKFQTQLTNSTHAQITINKITSFELQNKDNPESVNQ